MTDLRKAAELALEALEKLRFANAPFLDEATKALRQALAQPEQETVKCMYPYCETASGCDGPCSKPLTTPVDTVNISQERVDETAKREHDPEDVWQKALGNAFVYGTGFVRFDSMGGISVVDPKDYHYLEKKEWVGLTDDEIYDYADKFLYSHGSNYGIKSFGKAIEAKLKEKNT